MIAECARRLGQALVVVVSVVLLFATLATVRPQLGTAVSSNVDEQRLSVGDNLAQLAPELSPRLGMASYTVVMILSSTCKFCTATMPEYRHLIERAKLGSQDVRFIAVGPETSDVLRGYLAANRVTADEVRQITSGSRLMRMPTPTTAVVDGSGMIKGLWVGQLRGPQGGHISSLLSE
jgi:hypothetical protein